MVEEGLDVAVVGDVEAEHHGLVIARGQVTVAVQDYADCDVGGHPVLLHVVGLVSLLEPQDAAVELPGLLKALRGRGIP